VEKMWVYLGLGVKADGTIEIHSVDPED